MSSGKKFESAKVKAHYDDDEVLIKLFPKRLMKIKKYFLEKNTL